jgi:hypothetical protein
MDFVEHHAACDGAHEMALDTSEHAHHLIEIYKNRGYRFVEYAQWSVTNYRSVVLSKSLTPQPKISEAPRHEIGIQNLKRRRR